MIVCLFFVEVPQYPFNVEPYVGANIDEATRLYWLKVLLWFTHIFCFVGLLLISLPFSSENLIVGGRVFGILAMAV